MSEDDILDDLINRYPKLRVLRSSIKEAYNLLVNTYKNGGKLIVAGNGGSAADAEHMVGELMKSFLLRRPVSSALKHRISVIDKTRAFDMVDKLERPLPAISLNKETSLCSAYINDVGSENVFAQQILGLSSLPDTFIGISTSGNSENVIRAAIVAKAMNNKVLAMTGEDGGQLKQVADVLLNVPETETYKIQELHLPIYHCLCAMLEWNFFKSDNANNVE